MILCLLWALLPPLGTQDVFLRGPAMLVGPPKALGQTPLCLLVGCLCEFKGLLAPRIGCGSKMYWKKNRGGELKGAGNKGRAAV